MMAPRQDADTASPEPEEALTQLTFNQPLSWRAGKPIATGTLHQRLNNLSTELRDMEQDEADKSSLATVAKELAGANLIGHKDKGVRAFTACCLVDVLKICAPDAPFTATQLKDIFTLFVTSILPALSDPSNAYNTQHKYVLVSLAEVKSIVLLTDVPNSEQILHHLFTTVFDIVSGTSKTSTEEQIGKDVQYHMTSMLVTLVDEAANLQPEVVDIIVAQFLRAATPGGGKKGESDDKQSTLLPKEYPEAYNTAKTICNTCPDKMARYISQYFNDVMVEASSASAPKANGHRRTSDGAETDEDGGHFGPTDADLKELGKAHQLLRELWRASPIVLQNVIPQVEAEMSAENVRLRLLATETLGDMISGIGAAGPPPPPSMDPAMYPSVHLEDLSSASTLSSILITPLSPKSLGETYASVYNGFISRQKDKSPVIRSAWTTAVGRILVTSAGGIGLSREDQNILVRGLAEKLSDADEKVRLAAIRAVAGFGLREIVTILGPNGNATQAGSVLCNLGDRCRDRKVSVRTEGMTVLAKIWGVAAGEIANGNESVIAALGAIPSRIFDTYYTNDNEQTALIDHVMFEQLIPLSYPPIKSKGSKATRARTDSNDVGSVDPDKLRVERILLIVQSLEGTRSKKAFFALQSRRKTFGQLLDAYIQRCLDYNGGVSDTDTRDKKTKLDTVINYITKFLPDEAKASMDLHQYAKKHDRRSYQLLRFAMDAEKDFKTVYNSIREFNKRLEGTQPGVLDTLTPIIYRSSYLVYNRSHLSSILQHSRNDAKGLGAAAHEVLNEISERSPECFQASIKEMCKALEEQAPSEDNPNDFGSVEALKACANYARNGKQKLPSDRNFISALLKFASYGVPPKAAKYAVSILVATSAKKEMHVKHLLERSINGWKYGEEHFLTKLATISQLVLLEPESAEEYNDEILTIAVEQVLIQARSTDKSNENGNECTEKVIEWQPESGLDEEGRGKVWALKALVNTLRPIEDAETATTAAVPIYKFLNNLISGHGEVTKTRNTPQHHKSRLRLTAAHLMLKLCTRDVFDKLLSNEDFEQLALVAQDRMKQVRRCFIDKLQKYLVKNKLPHRFYTIIFLTAYEPDTEYRNSIMTWIRSRAKLFNGQKSHVMESILPHLLSLLAHHPDYESDPGSLKDHAQYILYYVSTIASTENLGHIYKYAERVKQAADAVRPKDSDKLYVLSEMAQSVIRKWEEKNHWSMQTWPLKVGLPIGIFGKLQSHDVAQKIAEKQYLPDEVDNLIDDLIKSQDRKKKRKSIDDGISNPASKKVKPEPRQARASRIQRQKSAKPVKASKGERARSASMSTLALESSDRGKSGRVMRARKKNSNEDNNEDEETWEGDAEVETPDRRQSDRMSSAKKTYAEGDSSDDDEEMWDGVAEWDYYDGEGNRLQPPPKDQESDFDEDFTSDKSLISMRVAEKENTPKPRSPEPETDEEAGLESTPTKSTGKKPNFKPSPRTRQSPRNMRTVPMKSQTPLPRAKSPASKAKAPLTKSTPANPAGSNKVTTLKAKPAIKAKASIGKGRGKGKQKTKPNKSIFDIDVSE